MKKGYGIEKHGKSNATKTKAKSRELRVDGMDVQYYNKNIESRVKRWIIAYSMENDRDRS